MGIKPQTKITTNAHEVSHDKEISNQVQLRFHSFNFQECSS